MDLKTGVEDGRRTRNIRNVRDTQSGSACQDLGMVHRSGKQRQAAEWTRQTMPRLSDMGLAHPRNHLSRLSP